MNVVTQCHRIHYGILDVFVGASICLYAVDSAIHGDWFGWVAMISAMLWAGRVVYAVTHE